jgi:Skp family chaperone for outer membrane proteins
MKSVSMLTLLGLTLLAGSAFAQTPPAQTPPKPQTPPPAQQPAPKPAIPPAATAAPVIPLPEGAKFAFIDLQRVADESVAGKAAIGQVKILTDKKSAEIQSLQTQLQALQQKRQTSSSVLTPQAVSQMDKDIERLNLDIQYKQQSAQKELEDLQNDLMGEFVQKVAPVVEAFAKEKGLLAVLDARSGAGFYAVPGMDISADIVKLLDAKVKK